MSDSNGTPQNPATPDDDGEIARLAALTPLQYDREREAAAKLLGVRVSSLDASVEARRNDGHSVSPQQGRGLDLPSPEPWPDPVDGAHLVAELSAALKAYVAMEDGAAETVALWVLHAHTHNAFPISPRLAVTSADKRCGKTTLLDVISHLVARALLTANMTSATLFRAIEAVQPTLLIDEADTFLARNDEMRGILNSGHRRVGAFVLRSVGDDHEPRRFSTWAPTAIAMIGHLPSTLADRSVEVRLRRRSANEVVARLRQDRCPELDILGRKAARWAVDNFALVERTDPELPECLQNRMADNWRPLIAIADVCGGDWPVRICEIAQKGAAAQDVPSRGTMLLADIRSIFKEKGVDRLPSMQITIALNDMEDRPWAEWKGTRALSRNALAHLLAPFGIKPQTVRFERGTAKGYLREQFEEAFSRYLPQTPPD